MAAGTLARMCIVGQQVFRQAAFNAKAAATVPERTINKRKMNTFMQAYERAAVKYAEYLEEKLKFSAKVERVTEDKQGDTFIFLRQENEAEKLKYEMQVLNQTARILKENKRGCGRCQKIRKWKSCLRRLTLTKRTK